MYDEYFRRILAIRNGDAARPERYGGIYWDFVVATGEEPGPEGNPVALHTLMRRIGCADEKFAKLARAFNQMADAMESDIEQRERTAAELALAREAADQANWAKSAFLANRSHELRTPISVWFGRLFYRPVFLRMPRRTAEFGDLRGVSSICLPTPRITILSKSFGRR